MFLSQRPRTALSADNTRPQYAPGETPFRPSSDSILPGTLESRINIADIVLPGNPNPNSAPGTTTTTQVFGPGGGVKLDSSPMTPAQTPTRIVDPNLNSEQQGILDDLFINRLGWTQAFQREMLELYYSLWGKTIPTRFTIISAPATTVLPNSSPAPTTTVLPNSAPAPAPSPVPAPAPTPTSTPVLEPGPINMYSSTQQQIADYYTAWENWQNWVKSQSSSAPATTVLPNSAPASATQSPSRKVDPNLNSQQQAALDELWVNNYPGWSEARQNEHMNFLYSMWGKTVPTSFTITTTPAPPPASNQYSISNQIQQGMNALMQGEELPPFSQPPQAPGPNIFDPNSNAFSGILQQLTDISNSNWRETYDPYGLNPPATPLKIFDSSYTPPPTNDSSNLLLFGAGVGALVIVYFYTKK